MKHSQNQARESISDLGTASCNNCDVGTSVCASVNVGSPPFCPHVRRGTAFGKNGLNIGEGCRGSKVAECRVLNQDSGCHYKDRV